MTDVQTNQTNTSYLQTLGAGLDVLALLAKRPFLTLAEVGTLLGWNASKAYRLLNTLERESYVSRTSQKAFYLGPATIAVGFSAHRRHPLIAQARDVLDWLVEKTSGSAYLVIRNNHSRVVLDMRDAPQRLRTFAPIGEEHPLYVSGAGLVLLAFSPPEIVEKVLSQKLAQITPATETDPGKIRQTLGEIRVRGYHIAREDFMMGAFSVGAPIFDRDGAVCAVFAVAGPLSVLSDETETAILERVAEAANELSARLGYSGGVR